MGKKPTLCYLQEETGDSSEQCDTCKGEKPEGLQGENSSIPRGTSLKDSNTSSRARGSIKTVSPICTQWTYKTVA